MNLKLKTFTICMLFIVTFSFAQTGIGTATPDPSAKLHVSATDKGFLLPKVSLTATNLASPITSPATGLLIYNLTSNSSVSPGFYYWNVNSWIRLIVPSDNATNVTGTVAVANGGTGVTTTSSNFIFAGPNGSTGAPSFRALVSADIPLQEASDEFTATANQTTFTLSNAKSSRSIYKLYINGIRISKNAYSISSSTFTYLPASNGNYSLSSGDRVQIDYFY